MPYSNNLCTVHPIWYMWHGNNSEYLLYGWPEWWWGSRIPVTGTWRWVSRVLGNHTILVLGIVHQRLSIEKELFLQWWSQMSQMKIEGHDAWYNLWHKLPNNESWSLFNVFAWIGSSIGCWKKEYQFLSLAGRRGLQSDKKSVASWHDTLQIEGMLHRFGILPAQLAAVHNQHCCEWYYELPHIRVAQMGAHMQY
jgi:hypothetical protein